MTLHIATAIAHPNIALVKYWGDLDPTLHIPANGSLSMNLDELRTRTSVVFDSSLPQDQFILNGVKVQGEVLERVRTFLDRVRKLGGNTIYAQVQSVNNYPTSAGLASSAAGFAALSLAATKAFGLDLSEADLSRLARTGSGSACRSIPGGFVEWQAGSEDRDSFAFSIAAADHWNIADCIAIISQDEKSVASSVGHPLAKTSPLQAARVADTPRRLALCRSAILERDFEKLADVVELDCNLMHAVMLTSSPLLIFWQPGTLEIIQAVRAWRKDGFPVCYTIDAGPNVHLICLGEVENEVLQRLQQLPSVKAVLIAHPAGPTTVDTSGNT